MGVYILKWYRVDGGGWQYLPEVFTSLEQAERARERQEEEESGSVVYRVDEVSVKELLAIIGKMADGLTEGMDKNLTSKERAIIQALAKNRGI
jgi:hypothetical protein